MRAAPIGLTRAPTRVAPTGPFLTSGRTIPGPSLRAVNTGAAKQINNEFALRPWSSMPAVWKGGSRCSGQCEGHVG